MIVKQYCVSEMGTNNYLLLDGNEAVLIDCTGDLNVIKKDIENNNLKYILLTHAHFDHIMGCNDFKKAYPNARLCMCKNDEFLLNNIQIQYAMFGLPNVKKPEIDKFIDEFSNLDINRIKIQVIHTPGHSTGSCSYYIDGKLFSGDTLFYEEVGRCDLPGGDFEQIGHSITEKLFMLPPETPVFPGHGPSSTIGHEIENNAYFGKRTR